MSVLKILKGSKKLLFSKPNFTTLGFLANLGIVTLSYIILYLSSTYIFSSEGLSLISKTHIFSLTYLILTGVIYKKSLGSNDNFNSGFILSAMLIILIILINYFKMVF